MKCTNCGFETNEDIRFCPACGAEMITPPDEVAAPAANIEIPNPFIADSNSQTSDNVQKENIYTPPVSSTFTPQSGNYMSDINNNSGYNQQPAFTGDQKIKNYLTLNIVFLVLNAITLCLCCGEALLFYIEVIIVLASLTISIIGVVYSSKVNKMIRAGNIQGALEASRMAKNMFYIGMILFIVKIALVVITLAIAAASGSFDDFQERLKDAIDQQQSIYQR